MSDVANVTQLPLVQTQASSPVGETAAILSIIERASANPSVDVAKMERLFQMHTEMRARQAETEFNAAMSAAQAELEPVGRGTDNKFLGTKYADLAALAQQCTPIVAKHGFGLTFSATMDNQSVQMTCDVVHSGGHSKRLAMTLPLDIGGKDGKSNKTPLQAFGSTTTYGRRYMTLMIFNVATAILDNDGNAPRAPRKSSAESKRDGTTERFNAIKQAFEGAPSMEDLRELAKQYQSEINEMPERWSAILSDAWDLRRDTLKAKESA